MHDFQKAINNLHILNEEDTAGRGVGPVVLARGLKKGIKKAETTLRVDYMNAPPKEAKFNLMNYYTHLKVAH